MNLKTIFESKNIRFVEVSEFMLKEYLTMVNDIENVAWWIGKRTEAISEEKEMKWVRSKLEEKAPVFSMVEKKSGEFIGNVEFMDMDESAAELGIAITAKKQNMGYGKEAVSAIVKYGMNELGLKKIFLKVYPDNMRAIHVYEQCGFQEYDRTDEDIVMEII